MTNCPNLPLPPVTTSFFIIEKASVARIDQHFERFERAGNRRFTALE
jgi:hypothetical protein